MLEFERGVTDIWVHDVDFRLMILSGPVVIKREHSHSDIDQFRMECIAYEQGVLVIAESEL